MNIHALQNFIGLLIFKKYILINLSINRSNVLFKIISTDYTFRKTNRLGQAFRKFMLDLK